MKDLKGTLFIDFVCVSVAGHEHVPSWVWVAAGLFNFLAYTLGESGPPLAQYIVFVQLLSSYNRLQGHFPAQECILYSDLVALVVIQHCIHT